MRKIFLIGLLLALSVVGFSCTEEQSGEEKDDGGSIFIDVPEDERDIFYKLIPDTTNLEILHWRELDIVDAETNIKQVPLTYCIGKKDNLMWIGFFKPISDGYEYLIDWRDSEENKTITINQGYGNIQNYALAEWFPMYGVAGINYRDEYYCFMLNRRYGLSRDPCDLVYITPHTVISFTLTGEEIGYEAKHWYEDAVMVKRAYLAGWVCYDRTGYLFNANTYYEKSIAFNKTIGMNASGGSNPSIFIYDFGASQILNEIFITDLPDDAKLNNLHIMEKVGNIWYCTAEFILYSGAKKSYQFWVDTDTFELDFI